MWKLRACTWLGLAVVLTLLSCHTAPKPEVAIPESQQQIGDSLKKLYMACSTAQPGSPRQRQLLQDMADRASNGKELLLVMRADVGVFPPDEPAGKRVRSIIAGKMIKAGTLNQLIEFATRYAVNPEDERLFAQRIFELAGDNSNPQIWYQIRWAANHLEARDLEQQAQAKGDQLSHGKTSSHDN